MDHFSSTRSRTTTGARRSIPQIDAILFVTAAILCLSGCKEKAPLNSPAVPLVEVTIVTQADVPIYHEWIGTLEGFVNAHIRAQVSGYLLSQNYNEGDPIKKGDSLFEIDRSPFKAAFDLAKGQLAQAELRQKRSQATEYGDGDERDHDDEGRAATRMQRGAAASVFYRELGA